MKGEKKSARGWLSFLPRLGRKKKKGVPGRRMEKKGGACPCLLSLVGKRRKSGIREREKGEGGGLARLLLFWLGGFFLSERE